MSWFEWAIKTLRHPLRLVSTVAITWLVLWGIASGWTLFATFLAVTVGLIAGEIGGRTRARLPAVLGAFAGVGLVTWLLGSIVAGWAVFPSILGPATALNLRSMLHFAALAFTLFGGLRALAARMPAWQAAEVGALALGFSAAFASHREGSIARPLWLSDWAWRAGYDPAHVLLVIGGVLGVFLTLLLLLESKRRLSILSALMLPLLAALAITMVDTDDLAPEPQASELSEIHEAMGDPPITENLDQGQHGPRIGDGGDQRDESVNPDGGEEGPSQPEPGQEEGEGEEEGEDQQGEGEEQEEGEGAQEGEGEEDEQGEGEEEGEEQSGEDEQEGEGGEGEEEQESEEDEGENEQQPEDENEDSDGEGGKDHPVAVVILGDNYSPPSEGFYLRQEVLSEYNGFRLVRTTRDDVDQDVLDHFATLRETVKDPPPKAGRKLVHGRVAMIAEHTAPFAIEGAVAFEPAPNPNVMRFRRAYRFESRPQTLPYEELVGLDAGHPEWSDEVWNHYLTYPDDPRYLELAEQITSELPPPYDDDPFMRALKIKRYLDKHTKYSKKARHDHAKDPTADYLFGNFIGYCVHTAHASVYLWRSVGIPSRVGTGYLVFEQDRRGSTLPVMGGDAHAWPEIYLNGIGWVVLDVAPGTNLDPPGQPVDDDLIQMLAEMAREEPQDETTKPRDLSKVRRILAYTLASVISTIVLVMVLLHWTIKLWRRGRVFAARRVTLPRVGYRLALDRLAEVGISRGFGETREDFARRVALVVPAFERVTRLHMAAHFSNPERPTDGRPEYDPQTWRDALRRVRVEVNSTTPVWRRLLGIFNPFSFYRAR